ncbi:RAQPRD family integrative conjugative element protein [Pseudomonas sp. GD03858]|uniref:integrative conjugative element protein, RAQPRD family n=1 Tax=unclassified Pseudomonas TaxID=196821 RepID=UPI00244730D0|nr:MULTISPECIES: RAQPRD family integrative conjugative element protein [unclassified Pseudomonas]MDH0645232.1 RAQPRD family integrative conjugative element protein [Pseudomonas sp. GD03867]MDH0660854.1 RAQPRD family integrative conjugative element protein [Pseudomonas sp. GD03858]
MNNSSFAPLLACLVSFGAAAQDVPERSDLGLVQRQLTSIALLADRASSSSVDAAETRYQFDYSMFAADLKRMRQGIHQFLSPSRAQPTDLVELAGQYRAEKTDLSHSDEHD